MLGLFAGNDDVDVIPAPKAVVGDRKEAIGVGWKVHADNLGFLVDHMIDESGVLMGEAVVILSPDVARQQVVERSDGAPPRDLPTDLQPLGMLVEHRIDDVDERLVAVEEAMTAGEEIPLEPPLTLVLGQRLHDTTVRGEVVVTRYQLGVPRPIGDLEHVLQAVGGGLVGSEETKGRRVGPDHVPEKVSEHMRRFTHDLPRTRHVDSVVTEVGKFEVGQEEPPVGVWVGAHASLAGRGKGADGLDRSTRIVKELLGTIAVKPRLQLG
jgi:hypothetical protein